MGMTVSCTALKIVVIHLYQYGLSGIGSHELTSKHKSPTSLEVGPFLYSLGTDIDHRSQFHGLYGLEPHVLLSC